MGVYLSRILSLKKGKITFNLSRQARVLSVNGIELRITGLFFCFEMKFNEVFNPISVKTFDISPRENDNLVSDR